MRAYSDLSEEALRARILLKDWFGEGFLTEAQYQLMERETVCDLRRTNVFLRVVLFLFTLILVGAGSALFFTLFLHRPTPETAGAFLLIFAGACYAGAEFTVANYDLYRHGIEEALAACSVGFFCAGLFSLLSNHAGAIIPATGAIASLWIWHRFGLVYAFLVAMIFVIGLPGYWTSSPTVQHAITAAIYTAGLIVLTAVRYRFTYLEQRYSLAEALLWLGIYFAINLQLWSVNLPGPRWGRHLAAPQFSQTFYWATWVLTWCLPPVVLWRGLLRKDRFVIAVGGTIAVLTLATNKPYLGWERHTWDPMLLGALLIGVALFLHRWLLAGAGGIRHSFTARRLSGKDKTWMNVASNAFGLASPHATASPHAGGPDVRFGGGESGGGGASSDF